MIDFTFWLALAAALEAVTKIVILIFYIAF